MAICIYSAKKAIEGGGSISHDIRAKKLTAKSYINRIQTVVNDFNDVSDFD